MAIPTYDEIALPLLQSLADGQEHHLRDLAVRISDHFGLSEEERNEMLPSSKSTKVRNRAGWAGFHLRKAGLAELSREATLRITQEGIAALRNPPTKMDRVYLMQFAPFQEFVSQQKKNGIAAAKTKAADSSVSVTPEDQETPEERMEAAFAELRKTLIADLLAKLGVTNPFRFEQVVLDLLVAMGYGGSRKEAAAVTQKTGDEGLME